MSMDDEKYAELLARLAAQESHMQWVRSEFDKMRNDLDYLKRDLEKRFARLRWEMTGGILILVLLQILLNLLK